MKYFILSLFIHSALFVYIMPKVVEFKELKSNEQKIKLKFKQITLKEEEKALGGNISNLSSKGESKDNIDKDNGIEFIDVNTLKMKYFSFYIRSKNIIDYHWKKTLTRHFPKNEKINVFFELRKDGMLENIIILSDDEVYKNELLVNFNKIKIKNPPKDLFMKSNTMFLRWVFETK